MVLISGNWRTGLIGLAASLVIFAVVYFTVISPSQNQADQAVKAGLQQTQQALNQAQQQLKSTPGAAPVQQPLDNAAKLTACLEAAGTSATALEACKAKYAG